MNEQDVEIFVRKTKLTPIEWNQFNIELSNALNLSFSNHFLNVTVNDFANRISSIFQELIDKFMPLRKLTRKEKRFFKKPWITPALKVSIKRKTIYIGSQSEKIIVVLL